MLDLVDSNLGPPDHHNLEGMGDQGNRLGGGEGGDQSRVGYWYRQLPGIGDAKLEVKLTRDGDQDQHQVYPTASFNQSGKHTGPRHQED